MMNSPLRLYNLPLMCSDSPLVECLTSYFSRLCREHRVSIPKMFSVLSSFSSMPRGFIGMRNGDARVLNSYGIQQDRVLRTLQWVNVTANLNQACLVDMGKFFSQNSTGAIKLTRHWCSECYKNQRARDEIVHDKLIWQLTDITICVEHETPLMDICPHCRQDQPLLTTSALDRCATCGMSLVDSVNRGDGSSSIDAYQRWLSVEIGTLLSARADITVRSHGGECGVFLSALLRSRRITAESLADTTQLPLDTLTQWMRGRNRPRLSSWLRVCASIGASPAATLLDPVLASGQLPLPFKSGAVYVATRSRPYRRHDRASVRASVSTELRRCSEITVKQLAQQVGIPVGMLYFYADDLLKSHATKKRKGIGARKRSREVTTLKSARRIVKRWRKAGIPITRKSFVDELMQRVGCSSHKAKGIFSVVMQSVRDDEERAP